MANASSRARALAASTGAEVIDLERAFADAEDGLPNVPMKSDGNHPTHAGSFLAALVIYSDLTGADLAKVAYRPFD